MCGGRQKADVQEKGIVQVIKVGGRGAQGVGVRVYGLGARVLGVRVPGMGSLHVVNVSFKDARRCLPHEGSLLRALPHLPICFSSSDLTWSGPVSADRDDGQVLCQ